MKKVLACTSALAVVLLSAVPAYAQAEQPAQSATTINQSLLARIERLEAELKALRTSVQQSNQAVTEVKQTAQSTAKTVKAVQKQVAKSASGAYSGAPSDTKWHLAGYADVGFVGGDAPRTDSFVTGKFNPGFHFQYKDLLVFESELEFSTTSEGETTTELEYSQFDIILNDYATLVVGKYLSPIGQFQERIHPSWINRIQGAPAGFGHDGVQPTSDTGIQVRGAVPLGNSRFTYVVAMGNGARTTSEGGVALEGMGSDDNSNKSIGGRLGFFPATYFELGASYLTSKVSGFEGGPAGHADAPITIAADVPLGLPQNARYALWGLDGAYTKGPVAARFEYLNSRRASLYSITDDDPLGALLPRLGMRAWYGQVSYRLSGFGDSDFVHRMEPVVRYGQFRISGNDILEEENEQDRFNIGLNYWLAPTIVVKSGLEWRDFKVSGVDNETLYQFQIAYGF
jgi:uncharacterized protein (UPF0335 family)